MSNFEFKDIEYVRAIIENKSFTKAAQSLFITQPTLSQYIKNMHKRLKMKILRVDGKSVMLTHEGAVFYEKGLQLLLERDKLLNDMNESVHSGRGILKLALPIGRGSHILTEILPEFSRRFPEAEIRLNEGSSLDLVDCVEKGISDLVIINETSFPLHIDYEILAYEKMLLVIAKNSPWAEFIKSVDKKYYVDMKNLKDAPFILHRAWQHSGQIERIILKNAGIKPYIRLETKNLEASYRLAACGYGITFLSEYHINRLKKGDETHNCIIKDKISNMGIIIGYKNKDNLSYLAKEFLKLTKERLCKINE
jgi:DNA-binding transcriptional LysR family regulator